MSLFGVGVFLAAFVRYTEDPMFKEAIIIIVYSITTAPLLYIVLYAVYVLFLKVKQQQPWSSREGSAMLTCKIQMMKWIVPSG